MKVLIEVSGGNVQSVSLTEPAEVFLLDYDNLENGNADPELAEELSAPIQVNITSPEAIEGAILLAVDEAKERAKLFAERGE